MVAPLVIDGPINGEWFKTYVAEVLVPTLKPGNVVILDNLSSHSRPAAREFIEAAGARMLFLPPYSQTSIPWGRHSRSSKRSCAKRQNGYV